MLQQDAVRSGLFSKRHDPETIEQANFGAQAPAGREL
jgi:hypothetical protein